MKLNPERAFEFYSLLMSHLDEKNKWFGEFADEIKNPVSSEEFEVFAAILCGERKTKGYGRDLETFQVKASCHEKFEYQYHRNRAHKEWESDQGSHHLFIFHDNGVESLCVYIVSADDFAPIVLPWKSRIDTAYGPGCHGQRCRRTVNAKDVRRLGEMVLEIENRDLVFSTEAVDLEKNRAIEIVPPWETLGDEIDIFGSPEYW